MSSDSKHRLLQRQTAKKKLIKKLQMHTQCNIHISIDYYFPLSHSEKVSDHLSHQRHRKGKKKHANKIIPRFYYFIFIHE